MMWHVAQPGHAGKNGGGQLVSPLRTILFGRYFTDSSHARRAGLPPAAFRRAEPMSDSLQAVLFNPYYVLNTPDSWLSMDIYGISLEVFRSVGYSWVPLGSVEYGVAQG